MFRKWLALLALLFAAIAAIVVLFIKCSQPAFRVVLANESVGAWTPLNNEFNTPDEKKRWHGVLAQLGGYTYLNDRFTSVKLSLNGTAVKTLAAGSFRWLNIVPTGVILRPMETSDVDFLMPPSGTTCLPVQTCAQNNGCVTDPTLMQCFRQEKIHRDLDVNSILTLWHGSAGYRVEAKPVIDPSGSHPAGVMKFEFQLDEGMQIEAYDAGGSMLPGFPLAPGLVDLVEVSESGGGNHGCTHSPPWLKP